MEQNESPEIHRYVYGQLIFNKDAKILQWEKTVSSTNSAGTTRYSYAQEKVGVLPHSVHKI